MSATENNSLILILDLLESSISRRRFTLLQAFGLEREIQEEWECDRFWTRDETLHRRETRQNRIFRFHSQNAAKVLKEPFTQCMHFSTSALRLGLALKIRTSKDHMKTSNKKQQGRIYGYHSSYLEAQSFWRIFWIWAKILCHFSFDIRWFPSVSFSVRLEFAVAPDTPLPKMFGQKPFVRLPENYKLVVSSRKDEQNENWRMKF